MSDIIDTVNNLIDQGKSFQDSQAGQTANQLWKQYGQGSSFAQWIEKEISKAKAKGFYKEGMSIAEVIKGNQETGDTPIVPDPNIPPPPTKKFTIMGMNGYVVITVAAVALIGGIYALTASKNKAA